MGSLYPYKKNNYSDSKLPNFQTRQSQEVIWGTGEGQEPLSTHSPADLAELLMEVQNFGKSREPQNAYDAADLVELLMKARGYFSCISQWAEQLQEIVQNLEKKREHPTTPSADDLTELLIKVRGHFSLIKQWADTLQKISRDSGENKETTSVPSAVGLTELMLKNRGDIYLTSRSLLNFSFAASAERYKFTLQQMGESLIRIFASLTELCSIVLYLKQYLFTPSTCPHIFDIR